MKYRLDLPSIIIANGNSADYTAAYLEHHEYRYSYDVTGIGFTSPPILMNVSDHNPKNLEDCFTADPEDWIADFKSEILQGKMPFWQLSEVSFSRKSTRLRFCNDRGGIQDLYVSKIAQMTLSFVVPDKNCAHWPLYTLRHDKLEGDAYIASSLVRSINNRVERIYEFCTDPTNRATRFSEYIIITEFH